MRNSKLILGGFGILTVAGAVTLSSIQKDENTSHNYAPRSEFLQTENQTADAQRELYERKRINVNTGQYDPQVWADAFAEAVRFRKENAGARVVNMSWDEKGPDNVGGRTRAILIDAQDQNHVYAGSVSGGLFESFDGGNNWTKVEGFPEVMVGSLGQSKVAPYRILVGTKNSFDPIGTSTGIWESTDNGSTWSVITGSTGFSYTNEIIALAGQDKFYFACSAGLRQYDGSSISSIPGAPTFTGCTSFAMSKDNMNLVANFGSSNRRVSTDGGATWSALTSSDVSSAARVEFAYSHEKEDGSYYLYAISANNSAMVGIHVSQTNGSPGTWSQIGSYSPIFNPPGTQGEYDLCITTVPGNPGKVFAAGLDLYEWNIDPSSNPAFGQWAQKSFWAAAQNSSIYVHADQHEFVWNDAGDMYIASDGGVGRSPNTNIGDVFFPSNRGFNVTQFYSMGFSAHGEVIGGAQDNGTQYNDFSGNTSLEFEEVRGGDGFTCDISHLDPDFMISSIQYGDVQRSNDKGFTWDGFFSGTLGSCGTPGVAQGGLSGFRTIGRLWENDNDLNSTDSIVFLADSNMFIGETAWVNSAALNIPVSTVLTQDITVVDTIHPSGTTTVGTNTFNVFLNPTNNDTILVSPDLYMLNVPLDTIKIQDVVQSWYGFGITGTGACAGVWVTRDAIKLANTPFWWHFDGILNPNKIEFSTDGDIMYVGTTSGELWRVSGLNTMYANEHDPGFSVSDPKQYPAGVTVTKIFQHPQGGTNGIDLEGIAIDPNDAGNVVITLSGFNTTNIYRSTSADVANGTTGVGSFSSIEGNLINMPVYDAIIDREFATSGLMVIGTEFGVYATDNGGTTWDFVSGNDPAGLGITPVYEVRQQWRGFDEGAYKPGEIYLSTFGRGIWTSSTYLSTPDDLDHLADNKEFIANLSVYPNPMNNAGKIEFDLNERAQVTVEVYSLTGRKVKEIKAGSLGNGNHIIDINADDLASGTYLVNLRAGNSRKTAKLIVNK